jgi:LmbE family N-acetylglucosaminyl deacetylase
MKKLMAIFAHPDDEGAMGGTLARYAHNNTEVMLVCGTRGEVGEISDPTLATPETLGEVRQKELESACEALGIQQLRFLDYRDSGMQDTPPNQDPRALIQADTEQAKNKIVGLIREFQPDVVVTFEPFGWYGHPDHIFVSKWVTEVFPSVGDATAYPDAGKAWGGAKLFHSVIAFSKWQALIQAAIEKGYIEESGFGISLPEEQLAKTEASVTHIVDVRDMFDAKQRATQSHATQFGKDSLFRKIPPEMLIQMSGHEHFIQIHPVPAPEWRQTRQTDLFS